MRINKRHDSFSSDDELPLKLSIPNGSDESNSYSTLCQPSINHCEFCDRVFNNKYKILIHNATHIIIPLLNQKLIECKECLFFFTSQLDYQRHAIKHSIANDDERTKKKEERTRIRNRIKFEDDIILNNTTDLLEDLTTECQVNLSLADEELIQLKDDKSNLVINVSDDDIPLVNNKLILGSKSMLKRDFGLETHLYMNANGSNNGSLGIRESSGEGKVNGDIVKDFKSVHYEDLIKPKKMRCRYCKQKFPNRYNLIIHETSHLDFDRRLPKVCAACDWYIGGNRSDLKRHRRSHSPKSRKRIGFPCTKCLQCGLYYRTYINHTRNYHNDIEDEKFDKIMRVCDLCYQFLKSGRSRSYVKIGTVSKVGKRYTCGRCTRKFFELNQVRKTEVIQNWSVEKPRNKKLTNDQRLKKIQHRLKRINNLRKF